MARDIIISAFATPSQGNLNAAGLRNLKPRDVQPLDLFTEAPLLVDVPKTGEPGQAPEAYGTLPFGRTAAAMKKKGNGSILSGLLKSLAPGVEPRRICLIGFSAGNKFVHDVLDVDADAELVDTVFSLDGLVYAMNWQGEPILSSFQPYLNFAERATGLRNMLAGRSNPYLSPLMVHAHTRIELTDPTTGQISRTASSTWKAGDLVFEHLRARYFAELQKVPEEVVAAQGRRQEEILRRLDQALTSEAYPVTVRCGGTEKTYRPDLPRGEGGVQPKVGRLGNYWDLDFGGHQGPDHCFIAYYAQRALWETYLVPRWNSRDPSLGGLRGLGNYSTARVEFRSPSSEGPGGAHVRPGVIDTGTAPAYLVATALAGAALGYWGYQWLR